MYGFVVVTDLEGKLVTHPTHSIDLLITAPDCRQRYSNTVASRGHRSLAEGDFQLIVFRDGANGRGGRALKRLQWMVLIAHRKTLRTLEGNSGRCDA